MNYSSPIRGNLRRFPKPEKPLIDRILYRVKQQISGYNDDCWWAASVAVYGLLNRHRRKLKNGLL